MTAAPPTSELDHIFTRDPLELSKSDEEIAIIIKEFRDRRHKFNLGDLKAGNLKAKKTKAQKTLEEVGDIAGIKL